LVRGSTRSRLLVEMFDLTTWRMAGTGVPREFLLQRPMLA
jgi:hypothetical protein